MTFRLRYRTPLVISNNEKEHCFRVHLSVHYDIIVPVWKWTFPPSQWYTDVYPSRNHFALILVPYAFSLPFNLIFPSSFLFLSFSLKFFLFSCFPCDSFPRPVSPPPSHPDGHMFRSNLPLFFLLEAIRCYLKTSLSVFVNKPVLFCLYRYLLNVTTVIIIILPQNVGKPETTYKGYIDWIVLKDSVLRPAVKRVQLWPLPISDRCVAVIDCD